MESDELEVNIRRTGAGEYEVQLRCTSSDGDLSPFVEGRASFDFAALKDVPASDASAYGATLFGQTFCTPELRARIDEALRRVSDEGGELRARIYLVGEAADKLGTLAWERLCDPATRRPLLLEKGFFFTRYLSCRRWKPVHIRPRAALRALVVVANPSDLDKYGLHPIDAAAEAARARENLGGIACTEITGPDTLSRMMTALREEHDVVYLVCHGAHYRKTDEASLWLEAHDGRSEVTAGGALVEALGAASRRSPAMGIIRSVPEAEASGACCRAFPVPGA